MLQKVQPGAPLRIPADAYNAFVDAAEANRQRRATKTGTPSQMFRQAGIVLIKNESGEDVERGGILGIDGPIITRVTDEDGFKAGQLALRGITPAVEHAGQFAVTLEPIANGYMGKACVSGACMVQVAMTDETHRYAMPEADDIAKLKSTRSGPAKLIYIEPLADRVSPDVAWCVSVIGSGDVRARRGMIVTEGPNAEEDFLDRRYWVKFAKCDNDTAADAMTLDYETDAETVMVTNLGEYIGDTHYLWDGQPVDVWSESDETDPAERRWYIVHPP